MTLVVRQDRDNSLWYAWANAEAGGLERLSQGFRLEGGAKEWADGFVAGWNRAVADLRGRLPGEAAVTAAPVPIEAA